MGSRMKRIIMKFFIGEWIMRLLKRIIKDVVKGIENNPNIKGKVGENKVVSVLNPIFFGKVEHRQINNLVLMDDQGKSHQIDHVEIRQNGVFCIETKNYSGYIFGNENQSQWTQCLYKEKHYFLNPVKQNKSHIYYIRKVLGKKYDVHSVVVFVQNNASKINVNGVINLCDLKDYLLNFNNNTSLTVEEMDYIYNTLLANANKKISNREHIKNIRKTQEDLNRKICPRCGGTLVLKNGKYGKFYGCEKYPKCKFILKGSSL